MIAALQVPFRDARAADLGLAVRLGASEPRPALAALALVLGGVRLELRILGGSHEARVSADGDGGLALAEVVACDAPGGAALPERRDLRAAGRRYRFRARTARLSDAALAALAGRLASEVGSSPRGLVGRFPGHPAALTAALAEARPGGVGWRTWHLYPDLGEVVRTHSALSA